MEIQNFLDKLCRDFALTVRECHFRKFECPALLELVGRLSDSLCKLSYSVHDEYWENNFKEYFAEVRELLYLLKLPSRIKKRYRVQVELFEKFFQVQS